MIHQFLSRCFVTLFLSLLCITAGHRTSAAPIANIERFSKFESAFVLPGQTGNPYDPDENDVDAIILRPDYTTLAIPAFWDGTIWRIRFCPTSTGSYSLTFVRNGLPITPVSVSADRFVCVKSANPGFVRVSAKANQFVFDNGSPYYPIGIDAAWVNPADMPYPVLFAKMQQTGLNWARVWTTYWDGKAFEWAPDTGINPPIGSFLPAAASKWDMVFDEAEKNGVYVQMVLQHHGQYTNFTDPNWRANPYNIKNGGFLSKPDQFFTDPEARQLTKAKFRYIVARWGYSTHLLSFELFNEVQNITEADSHFQDVVNWHKEMAAYIRSIDVNQHLITTSRSDPGTPLANIGLDYLQMHLYPDDILSAFATLSTAGLNVPLFVGEWGPNDAPPSKQIPELHDGLWSGIMDATAGGPDFWAWDAVQHGNWWPEFASVSSYLNTNRISDFGSLQRVEVGVSGTTGSGDLDITPSGGWQPTTRYDVDVPNSGVLPDLSGISSYIQGVANRSLMSKPIVFHVDPNTPCKFVVIIGAVSGSKAQVTLSLDGVPTELEDLEPDQQGEGVNSPAILSIPAGSHTVSLFNTGPDWFIARRISVVGYVPSVGALAKGDKNTAVFWAYNRNRTDENPQVATLAFPNLRPGRYRVQLWNPVAGEPGAEMTIEDHGRQNLSVSLPPFSGDIAGVVVKAGH